MMENRWSHAIETADGTMSIRHPEHGECFHSFSGAMAETELLYMQASGLQESLGRTAPLTVLDVGLGLGYNALATITAWAKSPIPPTLHLLSLEKEWDLFDQLRRGEGAWQSSWRDQWKTWANSLQPAKSPGGTAASDLPSDLPNDLARDSASDLARSATNAIYTSTISHENRQSQLHWTVLIGNAEEEGALEDSLQQPLSFVWQDPFSPKKNPGMWDRRWFERLRAHANADTVLATYSVARLVKDNLAAAAWRYELIPANFGKRQWLIAKPQ